VGANLTFVDFSLFELLEKMNFMSKGKTLSTEYANLKAFHERITKLPKFSEAWADDEKLMKKGLKPPFAVWNNTD
jgi:glutathione S-transferase